MITTKAFDTVSTYLFGGIEMGLPSNYYVGLSTTKIFADGSGKTEPYLMGYSRVKVINTKAYFTYSIGGEVFNAKLIAFPIATDSWGLITHIFLSDSATGGNIWYYDALGTPKKIDVGMGIVFLIGQLKFKMLI